MSEQCPFCPHKFPPHVQVCPHCGQPSRFPNVVAVGKTDKREVLDARYREACSQARSRNTESVVQAFEDHVQQQAKVCIARPLGEVERLCASQNNVYVSFYAEVAAGSRLPEDQGWDRWRQVADAIFFPNYQGEIRFGALSLNDAGPSKYGEAFMVLAETMIAHRTTLFETNSARYVKENPTITEAPSDKVAVWEDRAKLAVAKLAGDVGVDTDVADFPAILLKDGPHDGDDFIEAHVYGPISSRTLSKVTFAPSSAKSRKKVFFKNMQRKLENMGIAMEMP
ncbi:MAG: hypothetical protein HQL07_09290 [Nitrospirae bacterium]|nr:hypothetical protein [Magnetococcales bacterium]HAT49184.1 hypothetical protein [Alphaproteobacteria bacterium]